MLKTLLVVAIALALVLPTSGAAPIEIILDNADAVLVGTWALGTTAGGRYGSDYNWTTQNVSGGRTATYTPNIPITSSGWEVYTWYPAGTNRPTQAEYIVHSTNWDDYVYVNQQINGGTWVSIGTQPFLAGTGGYVRITNWGYESKNVMADAVRFYNPSGGEDTTPPLISGVSPTPDYMSAVIRWTTDEPTTSQVRYGLTTAYGSATARDSRLATRHTVYVTGLSPATTYHFKTVSSDSAGNTAGSNDFTFTTASAPIPEYRAMWVDTWGEGILSPSQVTALVNTAKAHNYNVIIPEVRKAGDAHYNSAYEPRASYIAEPPPWDPLQDLITKAHAEGIEVHAWIVTYRIWRTAWDAPPSSHLWAQHPEWAMISTAGENNDGTSYYLDPGIPGVQDYVCNIVRDIVSKYEVDGINFDYIRYQGPEWGYNNITRGRFRQEYGYYPPTSSSDANWDTWCSFRRRQVTDLVRKCYLEATAIRPSVKMSTCLTCWGGLYPSYNFTDTDTYNSVFQDWPAWAEEGIVDILMPMGYKNESSATAARDYRDWTDLMVDNRYGRHGVKGQGAYMNSIDDNVIQMQAVRDHGADGVATYSYRSTNDEDRPNSDFYSKVGTTVFASPAPVPEMTWKTAPTTGTIFGTVTNAAKPNDPVYKDWIYKATVTVTGGPVTRSTTTDATGTYGFLDLPPGTYNITVSKSGFPSRTYSGQTLSAGRALREDFDLGSTTATSPAGTVVRGWSLLSLPYQPVDPAPESVFAGIDIDNRLMGWNKQTQGQFLYDSWAPDLFGSLDVENGYWLNSAAPGTISYQAYPSNAATHDIPLPRAGWAIIGCPFATERQWASSMVRRGTETVSMLTAAHTNGWMNSQGLWWDAGTQGLNDFGLPEDFVTSETLQPWHGYWVRTYVNDLSLILQ